MGPSDLIGAIRKKTSTQYTVLCFNHRASRLRDTWPRLSKRRMALTTMCIETLQRQPNKIQVRHDAEQAPGTERGAKKNYLLTVPTSNNNLQAQHRQYQQKNLQDFFYAAVAVGVSKTCEVPKNWSGELSPSCRSSCRYRYRRQRLRSRIHPIHHTCTAKPSNFSSARHSRGALCMRLTYLTTLFTTNTVVSCSRTCLRACSRPFRVSTVSW